MSRRTILKLAALTIAVLGAVGCGGSESATDSEAKEEPAAVVALRAPLLARDAPTVLLRFGVPKGWRGIEGDDERLPVAAIEKPQGDGDCRLFVQIVAGPRGVKGLLQAEEAKLLQRIGARKRRVEVVAPGPPRAGAVRVRIYDARDGLSSTGPAARSLGELQITGDPAIPPLVIVAHGGLDGCTAKVPPLVVTQTRAALRVLSEQLSVEIRRAG